MSNLIHLCEQTKADCHIYICNNVIMKNVTLHCCKNIGYH